MITGLLLNWIIYDHGLSVEEGDDEQNEDSHDWEVVELEGVARIHHDLRVAVFAWDHDGAQEGGDAAVRGGT